MPKEHCSREEELRLPTLAIANRSLIREMPLDLLQTEANENYCWIMLDGDLQLHTRPNLITANRSPASSLRGTHE